MPPMATKPPVPAALEEVRESESSRLSESHCDELARYCGRDDYTWGFRIYRTVYSSGSDNNFEKALEVLQAYMRYECFHDAIRSRDGEDSGDDLTAEERAYYENLEPITDDNWDQIRNDAFHRGIDDERGVDDESDVGDSEASDAESSDEEESRGEIVDDRSNQQLWQRLKNDVVQDPSLDAATPAQLQLVFKQWIDAKGAEPSESSRYRFFIIMDSEVVQNLARVNLPPPKYSSDWRMFSVTIFDAEFDPSQVQLKNPERYDPTLVARLSKDEGWFWGAGWTLCSLFFEERANDREDVRTWDDDGRPIYAGDALCWYAC